jgi:alpha-tubulin suppressor-like RCC1 family protein
VNSNGVTDAIAVGSATLSVSSGGVTATVTVSVRSRGSQITSGHQHACRIRTGGAAWCFGFNKYGEIGDGTLDIFKSTERPVLGGQLFQQVVGGGGEPNHSCGLNTAGSVWCWGSNDQGQLGDGTQTNRTSPVAVGGGLTFVSIKAGGLESCGLTSGGDVYCWGRGRTAPTRITSPVPFTQLTVGNGHACGLSSIGEAYCWGRGDLGQLGDSTFTDRATPTRIAGYNFRQLVAGPLYTCGISNFPAELGRVYCWGVNWTGQLGDGTSGTSNADNSKNRGRPVPLNTTRRFVQLATTFWSACGIAVDATAWCWGRGDDGTLGNGTQSVALALEPTAVVGGLRFLTLSGGAVHMCGTAVTGADYCWGWGQEGQLGTGARGVATQPVAVMTGNP